MCERERENNEIKTINFLPSQIRFSEELISSFTSTNAMNKNEAQKRVLRVYICVCVCATHFEAIVHFWLLLFSKIELIQVQQAESTTTINCAIEHNAIYSQQYAFNSILQIKILFFVMSSFSFIISLSCP